MSLTTQLNGGDLEAWCAQTFPGTGALVDRVIVAARQAGAPVRPRGEITGTHWADVGGAFGQRLADLVDPAPPYAALLGMIRVGWLSWGQAHAEAADYPTHAELDAAHRSRALSLRRTPDGWMDLGPTRDLLDPDPVVGPVMVELLRRARRYQAAHAPAGTIGHPGAETGLARSAWLLGAAEGIYRSGRVDERIVEVLRAKGGVAELRAIPGEPVAQELVDLAARLVHHGVLAQWRRAAGDPDPGRPLGVAAPVLVPGWAEGDLLVGTAESTTLLDVKTVISLADRDRIARWLWQILCYAWLDTADLHRIRSVGLYLARHGVEVTWGLHTYAGMLLADNNSGLIERTRRAFRALVAEVAEAEGAQFPIA